MTGKTDKRLHARTKKNHEEMQSNWDKAFKKGKDHEKTKDDRKVRFRRTLFRKLVLQVEVIATQHVPEWGDDYPYSDWVDAKPDDLKSISDKEILRAFRALD